MQQSIAPATPFGRRPASLGQVASQALARAAVAAAAAGERSNQPQAVHKWRLFRTLTEIRQRLGVSDRALGVLNALLSFHPETALSLAPGDGAEGEPAGLVVFPSNRALALRAHGMEERTLRRHLAALAEAGLIIRRDSPNGKRYARGGEEGQPAQAFGFDLTPLVARAAEFEALAEDLRRAAREAKMLREAVSLRRRDVAKLVTLGLTEGLPGDWEGFRQRFLALAEPLRAGLPLERLRALEAGLALLQREVEAAAESAAVAPFMTGDDGDFVRHQSNSNTQPNDDLEPASEEAGGDLETKAGDVGGLSLGMVLEACPDAALYAEGGRGVRSWRDLQDVAERVRPLLGVSPSAWAEAAAALGEIGAAVALAAVLQRSEFSPEAASVVGPDGRTIVTVNGSPAIRSPGGYLRALTQKAKAGAFALGPVLMALIGQRLKARGGGRGAR